jgi:choline binding protein pcpA
MSEMMESLLGLLFLIIGLFVYFYYFSTFGKYRRWLKKNAGKSSYNDVIVRDILKNIGSNFEYSTENIPYGRSKWFINSSEYFTSVVNNIDGIEFYGYSPIRSSEEEKMIEYGVLLCQSGIFIKNEATNNDFYVPFSGLWKIVNKDNEVLFYYPYSIKKLEFPSSKIDLKSMTNSISALISTRYTTDLKIYEETELISERKFFQNIKLSNFSKNMLTSSIYSLNSSLLGHLHLKQFNSIVSGSAGHGHAAEYANDLIDKIKYPFKNVKQT